MEDNRGEAHLKCHVLQPSDGSLLASLLKQAWQPLFHPCVHVTPKPGVDAEDGVAGTTVCAPSASPYLDNLRRKRAERRLAAERKAAAQEEHRRRMQRAREDVDG